MLQRRNIPQRKCKKQPVRGPARESGGGGGGGGTAHANPSTDEALCRYDGIVGVLQNSSVTLDDSDNMAFPAGGSISKLGSGASSEAFGAGATAAALATALGNGASAFSDTIAIGKDSSTSNNRGTAVGSNSNAALDGTACGDLASTGGDDGTAIGSAAATGSGIRNTVLGAKSAITTGRDNVTLGYNNDATTFDNTILVGVNIAAAGDLQGEWGSSSARTTFNVYGISTFDNQLVVTGTDPTFTGSDAAGKVTIGTGVTTSCQVDFATAFAAAPACTIAGDNTAVTYAATTSTASLIITSSADMASDVISYICFGL